MSALKKFPKKLELYELEEYKDLKTLFKNYSNDELIDLIDNKFIIIKNSTGSELRLFLEETLEKSFDNLMNIDFSKEISNRNNSPTDLIVELEKFIQNMSEKQKKSESKDIQKTGSKHEINSGSKSTELVKKDANSTSSDQTQLNQENHENTIDNMQSTDSRTGKLKAAFLVRNIKILDENSLKYLQIILNGIFTIGSKYIDNNFLEKPMLILIFEENQVIPREIAEKSDYTFQIPYPTKIQRLEILEQIFKKMKVHTVDISKLSELTAGWNVLDLQRLIKAGYIKWRLLNFQEQHKNEAEIAEQSRIEDSYDESKIKPKETDETDSEIRKENQSDKTTKDQSENRLKDESQIESDIKPNESLNDNKDNKKDQNSSEPKNSENEDKKRIIQAKIFQKIPITIKIFEQLLEKREIIPLKFFSDSIDIQFNLKNGIQQGYINPSLIQNQNSSLSENASSINQKLDVFMKKDQTPSYHQNSLNHKNLDVSLLRGSNITEINSFSSTQLYQFAASTKFDELINVLEKLDQNRPLDDLDRKYLSDYSFVLRDNPKSALSRLMNAKKRIDKILKISSANQKSIKKNDAEKKNY